jgi:S1-C subfamily serine protease
MTKTAELFSEGMAEAIERGGRSLVHIHDGDRGAGAGSVWHADGLIVTNAHVARGNSIRVTLPDGRQMHGRVLAREPNLDLAAIGVEATGLPAAELGDSRGMRPGEMVMSMGHPWGVEGAATAGVVIGIGEATPEVPMAGREWIVAGLRLRPGHSGGPMVDAHGRLVGINTMITGPAVAMAVPVHVAKEFLVGALQLVQQLTAA